MRRLNKRGEASPEGVSSGLIIAVILVVIVALAIYFGYNYIMGAGKQLPSGIQTKVTACQGYVQANLDYDFCNHFDPIIGTSAGINTYANCNYAEVKAGLVQAKVDTSSISCGDETTLVNNFCLDLVKANNLKDNTLVNGQSCQKTCGDIKQYDSTGKIITYQGSWVATSCPAGQLDITSMVVKTDKDANAGKVCCLGSSVQP